ncbi:hypothetical protein PC110_g7973 [Phytophthora cactorum]|uniref:Uncharacterized protein n=1 Tax=Phytophthora cactorum TaxID=29920 RepID=A0A329SJK1_9STRA|nr:hypothetical protein PC110_g7973 [Phytophthora cactorum]
MVGRGRRAGYQNYSVQEQTILCTVVGKYKPTGRNVWESVAVENNSLRAILGGPRLRLRQGDRAEGMCHTSHDGHDNGDDDKQLRNVVAAATSSAPRANAHDASEDNTEESEDDDEISESGSPLDFRGPEQEDKQQPQLVGSVVTSRGVFDISLADEAWSDGVEDEEGSQGDTTNLELASAEQTSHQATGHAEETLEPDRRQPVDPKSIVLLRGASRFLLEDQHSREILQPPGRWDLRIIRDNLDVLGDASSGSKGKRHGSETSSVNGTYTANKRVRAKKWMDQREKEVRNEEAKTAAARNEMMGLQIYLREESNLRSENKAIRRREDSEQREPLKKLDAKSVITLAAKKLHPQNSTDRRTSPKAEPVMRKSPLTEKNLTSDTSRG